MTKQLLKILGIQSDFEQLFFIKEYRTLSGEKRRIILALILILFLTLLALGYAVGSIQNLEQKMNNPFTNWVDLSIREDRVSKMVRDIETDYTSPEKKAALQIDEVRGWVMFNMELFHQNFNPVNHRNDTLSYPTWGRSLESDDPLMENILKAENLLWKSDEVDWEEKEQLANCEIILTEELVQRLGFAINDQIGSIFIREGKDIFAAKIVAVIKELPKFCDFVCSPLFYNIKNAKRDGIKNCGRLIIQNDGNKSNYSFLVPNDIELSKLKATVKTYFDVAESPDVRIAQEIPSGDQIFGLCEISFLPTDNPSPDSLALFIPFAKSEGIEIANFVSFECNVNYCDDLAPQDYYYLAFNFNRLDDIRAFRDDIKDTHQVDIDMSQVEAKENFALVSRLTLAISSILLAFGILSIILFVNSLLRSHLSKVRSNLGTFKAFGLSNHFLNTIYLKIIFSFLLFAILFALIGAILIDRVEQFLRGAESQFNIFSPWIAVALLLLVIISLFISFRTIKNILGDTPGNLIYGR